MLTLLSSLFRRCVPDNASGSITDPDTAGYNVGGNRQSTPRPAVTSHFAGDRALWRRRWEAMIIRPSWESRVEAAADRIERFRGRYQRVAISTGVPWDVVGVLHLMESGCDFTRHLHNGDPLSGRTRRVPAGRPEHGKPPFTWEASAVDALEYDGLDEVTDWSIGNMLYQVEKYNGFGYFKYHPDTPSPYLWSGSTHYTRGKYVADGRFDPYAVSQQAGAAVVLKALRSRTA